MGNFKASPQAIIYFIVGLIFIPRFFSDLAYNTGTLLILIFWIAPFVMISEMENTNWNKKVRFFKLPKFTSSILIISIIIISASFYWRELIYTNDINSYQNIKRSLYFINPLILSSCLPFIKKLHKKEFLIILSILTVGLFSCLTIPKIFEATFIGDYLNNLTASISGLLIEIAFGLQVKVDGSFIYAGNGVIRVGGGCSSTPQIMISLFASLSLYICCKIRSKISILFYLITVIAIGFTFNAFRITILSYLVSEDKIKTFDFWHDGAGSLIFSFFVMLVTCSIYYYLWAKENKPIK